MRRLKSLVRDSTVYLYWRRLRFRPIAFMHVPKTAGTSLMESIHAAIRPRVDVRGFDRCLFGDFTEWNSLLPDLRRDVYLSPEEMPRNAGLIMGHFALSSLRARYPWARLVTVLREPESRLLSHFVYWRSQTDAMLRNAGPLWSRRVATARGTLEDFLADPSVAAQTDNIVTRMLLWPDDGVPPGGFIDPADDARLLADARRRLRDFSHVGFVEQPGGIFPGLARMLHHKLEDRHLNETAPVPAELALDLGRALTPRVRHLLVERSRLDLALWQDAAGGVATELAGIRAACVAHLSRRLKP